jgi:GLPGLI family protein
MKKILLILIFSNLCNAQVTNGIILYKRIYSSKEENPKIADQLLKSLLEKADDAKAKIDFTLNFNTNEVYFFANKIMLEGNLDKVFPSLANSDYGKYKYYQNKKESINRELEDYPKIGILIIDRKTLYEWRITSETKQIGDYKCFKAVTKLFDEGKKIDDPKTEVTAWFAPSIPVPFGPCGYGDLPGLILELRFLECVYGATNISLNNKKPPFIDALTNQISISETDYNEIITGSRSTARNKIIEDVNNKKKQ